MRKTTSSNQSGRKKVSGPYGRVHRKTRKQPEEIGSSKFDKDGERVLKITCFKPTPSPNEWAFKTWRAYYTIKTGWLKRLHDAAIKHTGAGIFGPPITRCSLEIERRGIRTLDEDNLTGGLKPVIDSLAKLGFLADDTPDVIVHTYYHQTRVPTKGEQRTIITLREMHGRSREQQISSETTQDGEEER